jgi:DNA-binding NarL/FixJ family response regulator
MLRAGLQALLRSDASIEVVDDDGSAAVVVHLIGVQGEDGLEDLRASGTSVPRLVIGPSGPGLLAALHDGARGCLPISAMPEDLRAAVHALARGEGYIHPTIAEAVLTDLRRPASGAHSQTLTARERQILVLLCEGYTNRAIADRLHLSVRTVESHRANLMMKLDADALPDLVFAAIRMGLIKA